MNILIWGAAGGIGKALTARFIQEGHTVVAISRHPSEMKSLTPHTIAADVTQPAQVMAAARLAGDLYPSYDLYCYTAGDILSARIAELASSDWNRILAANLSGAFLTAQASLSLLSPQAPLLFLGAIHERLRLPGLSAYAAAKAGLEAFAEVLRKESRRRVLVVRPGAVATPLWNKVPFSLPKNALTPSDLAERIYIALRKGQEGLLDL